MTHFSDSEKSFYAWIPKNFDPSRFMEEFVAKGMTECFFSVSLSRANIFFKAPFKGYDDGGLRFDLPEKVFKVQRRKDMRFPIQDGHVLRIQIPDPLIPENMLSKKVHDISASGLAFLVPEEEVPLFQIGTLLKGVTFSIQSRKITVDAEVRHLREMPKNSVKSGFKVGIQFKNILPPDSHCIASYVFEESRKFFTKFI